MKKILFYLNFLILLAVGILVSCDPPVDDIPGTITVEADTCSFASTSLRNTFTFCTNGAWTASSNQSWMKVAPNSGGQAGDQSLVISFTEPNPLNKERTALLTIKCKETTATVTVIQRVSLPFQIQLPSHTLNLDEDTQQRFTVVSEESFSLHVEPESSWLTLSQKEVPEGTYTSEVTIMATMNSAFQVRRAKVVFTATGGGRVLDTLALIQPPFAPGGFGKLTELGFYDGKDPEILYNREQTDQLVAVRYLDGTYGFRIQNPVTNKLLVLDGIPPTAELGSYFDLTAEYWDGTALQNISANVLVVRERENKLWLLDPNTYFGYIIEK